MNHQLMFRKSLALLLGMLLVSNILLVDLQPAWARTIQDVKTELDSAHRTYMDGVKSGSDPSGLFSRYESLLKEYNDLKAATPDTAAVTGSDGRKDSLLTSLWTKVRGIFKAPWVDGKKEMSTFEKVLWGVAKAVIPTLAVIAMAGLVALPMTWMIVAAMATGGISGGLVNYFYEKRMNKYRDEDSRKSSMEIFRDVLVSGVTEAVMAPFNLLTMGMTGQLVRHASTKMMLSYGLKSGASYFAGKMLSNAIGGSVRWGFHRGVFKDHLKVTNMEREAERILARHEAPGSPPLTPEEKAILAGLDKEITRLKANDYSMDKFVLEAKTAAVGAVISGAGGTVLSKWAANSNWAAGLSMKIFKDTAHTGMVSQWIMSNPTSFLTGAANAQLNRHFVDEDIARIQAKRDAHTTGSPIWQYYQDKAKTMETQRDNISPFKEGAKAMLSNFAIQSAMVGVAAIKTNAIDLPRQRNAEIQKRFMDQSSEGKRANDAQNRYDQLLKEKPALNEWQKYGGYKGVLKAREEYFKKLSLAKNEMYSARALADQAFKQAKGTDMLEQIRQNVDTDNKINRRLDLARYLGDEEYLEAWKYKVRMTPGNERKAPLEIEQMARESIRAEYASQAEKLGQKFEQFQDRYSKYKDIKDSAMADDKAGVANLAWRKVAQGEKNLTSAELQAIEYQASNIPPSKLKTMWLDWQVAELKAGGATDLQIHQSIDGLAVQADDMVLDMYGSWRGVLTAEVVAGMAGKIPYEDDGDIRLMDRISKVVTKDIPTKIEQGIINDYKARVNNEIKANILPVVSSGVQKIPGTATRLPGDAIDKFMDTFITQGTKVTTDGVIDGAINRVKQ